MTILLFFLSLLIFSCGSKEFNEGVFNYSFDELQPYVEDGSLSMSNARSGKFSIKIDEANQYGITFKSKFGLLKKSGIKNIHISAWIRADEMLSTGNLVCAINQNDKTVLWNAIDFSTFIAKPKEWSKISGHFDISKFNKPDNELVIYPMFKGKGTVWVDDLEIKCD